MASEAQGCSQMRGDGVHRPRRMKMMMGWQNILKFKGMNRENSKFEFSLDRSQMLI